MGNACMNPEKQEDSEKNWEHLKNKIMVESNQKELEDHTHQPPNHLATLIENFSELDDSYNKLVNLTKFDESLAKKEGLAACSDFAGPYKLTQNNIFRYYKGHFIDGIPNGFGLGLVEESSKIENPSVKIKIFVAGNFTDGYLNGNYTAILYEDCHFVGKANFKEQLFDGKLVDVKDNYIYTGKSNKRGKFGKGVMNYPNGSVYEGEFLNDMKHGSGKITFSNGSFYDGEWKQDKING